MLFADVFFPKRACPNPNCSSRSKITQKNPDGTVLYESGFIPFKYLRKNDALNFIWQYKNEECKRCFVVDKDYLNKDHPDEIIVDKMIVDKIFTDFSIESILKNNQINS